MTLAENIKTAESIAALVSSQGGTCYYVGGFVRDRLLNIENKDIDIEVHGISPEALKSILDRTGRCITIGESFGIYTVKGCDIDIAMPRRETAIGRGHRDFFVCVDASIGTYKAALRRDFTVNALMQNVLTGEIIDHFSAFADIESKTLRHVNSASFPEDPLRVLRAAQFAARLNFHIVPETVELCKSIDISSLSKERIEGEMKKALLKAERPSVFFENMRKMDKLGEWFRELEALIGVPQPEQFHLEGDVFNHTMAVLDEAAKRRSRVSYPYGFMMAALCHDFGKAVSTYTENGKIRSIGHEKAGLPLISEFLHRITGERRLIRYVLNLSELHMRPNILAFQNSKIKATNKLFDSCEAPSDLIELALSDDLGRKCLYPHETCEEFLYERLKIYNEYMSRPFVTGKDLIDAGLEPDEKFSDILAYAHKLRLSGVEKEKALRQAVAYRKEKDMPKKV